jgi:putative oxidoreductase
MLNFCKKISSAIEGFGVFLQPILLLAIRLYWGGFFMLAGWGKFQDISGTSDFFSSINIPLPLFNAYLVSSVELVGGFCLVVGLFSRIVSVPLICTMIVALITTHSEELKNVLHDSQNLMVQVPFIYLFATLIILAFGAGKLSLDALLFRKKAE